MKRMLIAQVAAAIALLLAETGRAQEVPAKVEDPDGFSNLRDKAGKVIGKVKSGETITVTRPEDGSEWRHVRLGSGKEGYIHKSRLILARRDAKPAPGKPVSAAARKEAIPRETDVSIAGIRISDPESTERVLGKNVRFKEENNGFPVVRILNATRTEVVELTQHYGGVVNEVREIEVKPATGRINGIVLPKVAKFTTGKGIHLGMTEEALTAILGKPVMVQSKGESQVFEYLPKDAGARYRATPDFEDTFELYYGHYTFRDGSLREFAFGMVYP